MNLNNTEFDVSELKPEFSHIPVLLDQCIDNLNIRDGSGIFVDGTVGGGGHSFEIANRLTTGRLVCFDQDEDAIRAAKDRLAPFSDRVTFVQNNFCHLSDELDSLGIERIDGLLLDLGVSSYQLDNPERGFSYMADAPLDMRMNQKASLTAYDVVNTYSEERLKKILFEYGDERFAPRIAFNILRARAHAPISTTFELVDIIKSSIPAKERQTGHHPAKKTFQAIRIEVNSELEVIESVIGQAAERLNPSGRICIITFQPDEDKVVKQTLNRLTQGCTCPKDFPVCVCGKKPILKFVNKKPILPDEREIVTNPRSRSAKLRVAEKI